MHIRARSLLTPVNSRSAGLWCAIVVTRTTWTTSKLWRQVAMETALSSGLWESWRCGIFKSFRSAICLNSDRAPAAFPSSGIQLMNHRRLTRWPNHYRINPGDQPWRAASLTFLHIEWWVGNSHLCVDFNSFVLTKCL